MHEDSDNFVTKFTSQRKDIHNDPVCQNMISPVSIAAKFPGVIDIKVTNMF